MPDYPTSELGKGDSGCTSAVELRLYVLVQRYVRKQASRKRPRYSLITVFKNFGLVTKIHTLLRVTQFDNTCFVVYGPIFAIF